MVREHLAEMVEQGLVTPTGLISHGRGEAFDYLMGEHTIPPALEAERVAAAYLLKAQRPVVCVNGNSIALDPKGLIGLARSIPAKMEVNIFHRTEDRMRRLVEYMISQGADGILGLEPDERIPNLTSDRALCTHEGIYSSDVIVVPIEDGDRAEALVAMGKIVISIDLNPLSRTSKVASVPISDEITRAVANITKFVEELRGNTERIEEIIKNYSSVNTRRDTISRICESLMAEFKEE